MSDPASQLGKLLSAVADLTDEVSALTRKMGEMEAKISETRDIVQAWEAAKVGGKFIKWVGGLATSFAAIWLLMKVGFSHMIGGRQ